jgi:hypothetical protein
MSSADFAGAKRRWGEAADALRRLSREGGKLK